MARKSKVSGISLECGTDMWKRDDKKYKEIVDFHRKNVPTNHTYKVKRSDHTRLRKILYQADSNYIFFGVENVLLQYHYDHKFYEKKWFRRFVNILYYGWMIIWISIIAYHWVIEKFFGG